MSFSSLEEVRSEVQESGGVLTVSTEELRNAVGHRRLGKLVGEQIRERLDAMGIRIIPSAAEGDLSQHPEVRLYLRNTQAGRLIDAVRNPGASGDELIQSTVDGVAGEVLQEIKLLVSEV